MLLIFLGGSAISAAVVGIRGHDVAIRLGSRPNNADNVTNRLLMEGQEAGIVPSGGERQYVKEAFARQLRGMTWTWDHELQPAQP